MAAAGVRRFGANPRFDLENVRRGIAQHPDNTAADAELVKRIAAAYRKAEERQLSASSKYRPTKWWTWIRQTGLRSIIAALRAGDIEQLGRSYANFFRDPCCAGLISAPPGLPIHGSGAPVRTKPARAYLGELLDRIDYWKAITQGQFDVSSLTGPPVGNPFGVDIDGTLVTLGAPYQHYCAHRVIELLGMNGRTVVEIGGGFGGMAYYLLRDRPGVAYLNFDVPESIALSSYYLMKSFPDLKFQLFGESPWNGETPMSANVALFPVFEIEKLRAASADVTFSSHAITDISEDLLGEYLDRIGSITRRNFLVIGHERGARRIAERLGAGTGPFTRAEVNVSRWDSYRAPKAAQLECSFLGGECEEASDSLARGSLHASSESRREC